MAKRKEIEMMVEGQKVSYEMILSRQKINKRIARMGEQISRDYQGKELKVIVVLNGAIFFGANLMKKITVPVEMDSISVASYPDGRIGGQPRILSDLKRPIAGEHVLVVEDIVDTGYSIEELLKIFRAREPKDIKIAALFSKDEGRKTQVPVNYLGFRLPNMWVVGCGLDDCQKGRNLEDLYARR